MANRAGSGSSGFDPTVTANYNVFLGDSILRPEKGISHTSIKFNTKSQSSDRAVVLKTDSKTYKARLPRREGSKIPTTYTGTAVANGPDKYVLVFDKEKDGFVLDKLDSSFAFNLDTEDGDGTRRVSLDEGSETEVDSDGDATFSDGDPDNPYDYRHFLEKPSASSHSQRSAQSAVPATESKRVYSHHRATPSITKTSPDAKPKVISTPQSTNKSAPKSKTTPSESKPKSSQTKYASSLDNADNESSTSSTPTSRPRKEKPEVEIIESEESDDDDDFRFENDDGTIYKKTSKPQIRVEQTLSAVGKTKGEPISLRSATNSANHSPMGLGIKLSQEQRRQQQQQQQQKRLSRHSSESSSEDDGGSRSTTSRQPVSLSQRHGHNQRHGQSDSDADLVSVPLNIGSPALPAPAASALPKHADLLKIATPIHNEVSEEEFEAEFEQAFAEDAMEDVIPTPAPIQTRRALREESEESEED